MHMLMLVCMRCELTHSYTRRAYITRPTRARPLARPRAPAGLGVAPRALLYIYIYIYIYIYT